MLPMASMVTARPSSRIHCTSRSRPARSSSLSASRQLPPPGKAPMRLNASSRPSNRLRSIRGDVRIPAPPRILVQATGPVYHGRHEFRDHALEPRGATRALQRSRSACARDAVEACPALDSVWCGDALFVNRRLDALTLLAAVAGRTERVLLGPACMGSFALRNPLVFAYEWA